MSLVRVSTSKDRLRVGVLVSGGGSNLQAFLLRAAEVDAAFEVSCVVSNRPGVFALERAERAQVPALVVDHKTFETRAAFEEALVEQLQEQRVELVVLAGFMRVLSDHFLAAFPFLVVNVHPALCPSFPGMHAARQALEAGVRVTGCTVHLVDHGVDTGPILEQSVVLVDDDENEASLTQKIQAQEHKLFPKVVQNVALGRYDFDEKHRIRRRPSPV
ncbi:MAG: phosphoribosylglycinamide formyltransferase [Deltaproteobacteria bacterium]|nr:phosphoribosylglycinamide formyltransferase [Deltaproteobacteria bacterium]